MSVYYKGLPSHFVRNMTPRVESKSSELVSIFHEQSGWNLARVKFFVLMISALCKVQTVGFEKLATAFDCSANTSSSLRRIQRFMATFLMDTDLISRLIFRLLPYKPPFRLARIARIGSLDSRILMFWCSQLFIMELLSR